MRVAAFDLSLTRTGTAWDGDPEPVVSSFKPPGTGYRRNAAVAGAILTAVERARIDVVLLEDYAPNSIGRLSTIRAAELGGFVRTQLELRRIRWLAVPPSELKRVATGSGTATKDAMLEAARDLYGRRIRNHDEADAVLLWHHRRLWLGI